MRLDKILAMVVIVTTIVSCSVFKKSEKHTKKQSLEVYSKKDSLFVDKVKKDSVERTLKIDKGVISTEIETTTIIEKKGRSSKDILNLDKIKHGLAFLIKDSSGFKISLLLDTLKNELTIESESPTEKITTTTKSKIIEKKDSKEQKEKSSSSEQNKQVAVTQENRQRDTLSTSDKKSEPSNLNYLWIFFGIVIVILCFIFFKKIKGVLEKFGILKFFS